MAGAATITMVRDLSRTGEFASPGVSDTVIQAALDEGLLHMNEEAWGDRFTLGHALLAAHLLVDGVSGGAPGSGVKGPVVSESLGPASRTYATSLVTVQGDVLQLNGTTYGRRHLALRSKLMHTPRTAWDGTKPPITGGW